MQNLEKTGEKEGMREGKTHQLEGITVRNKGKSKGKHI